MTTATPEAIREFAKSHYRSVSDTTLILPVNWNQKTVKITLKDHPDDIWRTALVEMRRYKDEPFSIKIGYSKANDYLFFALPDTE